MVTETVPVVAPAAAVRVSVLVPVEVGFGLNEELTPLGNVEVTARPTLPVKPFAG